MSLTPNVPDDQERRLIEEVQRWRQEHAIASVLVENLRQSVVYEDLLKLMRTVTDAREHYTAARRVLQEYRYAKPSSK